MAAAEISVRSLKHVDVIAVSGRIDSSNANELEAAFQELAGEGRYKLVLELSGIEYMSSAGLRAMVAALRECRKHSGDVRVASPSPRMGEVLNLAGLDSVFSVHEDEVSAVGSY